MKKELNEKKFKRNPLSYLGWLGWIGIIGIFTGDWLLQLFIMYFFFFGYGYIPADELFWANLRKAGFRAFVGAFIFGNIMIIVLAIMERMSCTFEMIRNYNRVVFFGCLGILCFFVGSLIFYNYQDKKYLENKDD